MRTSGAKHCKALKSTEKHCKSLQSTAAHCNCGALQSTPRQRCAAQYRAAVPPLLLTRLQYGASLHRLRRARWACPVSQCSAVHLSTEVQCCPQGSSLHKPAVTGPGIRAGSGAWQRRETAWYANSSRRVSWIAPSRTSTLPKATESNTCGRRSNKYRCRGHNPRTDAADGGGERGQVVLRKPEQSVKLPNHSKLKIN